MPLCVAALGVTLAGTPARAGSFMSREEALGLAFPGATIESRSYAPDSAVRAAVRARAQVREVPRLVRAHVAWRGDTLAGAAFLDTRTVRTMPGTFMIVVAPDTTVSRVDVLAFHEPPDYRPVDRWLAQFEGRPLDDELWPERAIHALSGATLSARAVTEAVRLSLALYEIVVAPDLRARGPRARTTREPR